MKFTRKTDLPRESGTARPGDERRAELENPKPRAELENPKVSVDMPPRAAPRPARGRDRRKASRRGSPDGQMLIAMPSMGDERFERTVIYVCAHSTEGAMGLIVNKPGAHISFAGVR